MRNVSLEDFQANGALPVISVICFEKATIQSFLIKEKVIAASVE